MNSPTSDFPTVSRHKADPARPRKPWAAWMLVFAVCQTALSVASPAVSKGIRYGLAV